MILDTLGQQKAPAVMRVLFVLFIQGCALICWCKYVIILLTVIFSKTAEERMSDHKKRRCFLGQ